MPTINEPKAKDIKEKKLYLEMGLTDSEFEMIESILGRTPNYTETGIFSVMWSEHCSYKKSKPLLKKFTTSGERVLQGPGEGAGIVDIGDGLAVVFKIESHNHPSAVEPFHGAATGVGGIVRDVFSMGARPIALLNSLRFGELDDDRTKYLFEEIVKGMADYGNTIEVPTVGGEIQFDDCYKENPLVNAMCVGLMKHDEIQVGQAKGIGNTVMYIGAKTGREGIHGATFASVELNEEEVIKPETQVGDPVLAKQLIEACLEITKTDALVGIQDMGAAGLTSSASEMASKANTGIELNLDLVPKKDESITPYEMMLSETQERMLLIVEKGKENVIDEIAKKYGLEAVAIGQVIEEKNLRLLYKGEVVTELPVDALAEDAPVYHMPSKEPESYAYHQSLNVTKPEIENANEVLKKLLQQPTIASKEWVYSQFDQKARGNTVVTSSADAAIVRVEGTDKALAMTTDCNSRYFHLDPYTGGLIAISEAARNLVASGAEPIALTDGLNFGSPDKAEVFWGMEKATDGLAEAARTLNIPIISGNVSLYNESNGEGIYPTPIIGMVGIVHNMSDITTQHVKEVGDFVYLIGHSTDEIGGSEVQKLLNGKFEGKAPHLDLKVEVKRQKQLLKAIQNGVIESAHDISDGGLAVALAEKVMTTDLGIELTMNGEHLIELFSETQSRFIVTVKEENRKVFESLVDDVNFIGYVTNEGRMKVTFNDELVIDESVDELTKVWKGAIPCLLK